MAEPQPQSTRIPPIVWVVAVLIASIEPVMHSWLAYAPPEGTAHTGLRVPDTNVFLHSMQMFETDFRSNYTPCTDGPGHGAQYYASPGRWMLGVLGWVTGKMGLDTFIALGLLNGLGMFAYLIAVYGFMRTALPKHAITSFVLFALSGGFGGIVYIVTGLLGLHDQAQFEPMFLRFAHYELFPGTHLAPHLHGPFLYYTLPLALLMLAFSSLIRSLRDDAFRRIIWTVIALGLAAFLNVRLSAPGFGIALLLLMVDTRANLRLRIAIASAIGFAAIVGGGCAWAVFRSGGSGVSNVMQMAGIGMWVTPFITAAIFHVATVPRGLRIVSRDWSGLPRVVMYACGGYLALFGLLFCGYQLYYGNILVVRDAVAAMAVSDWALIGAVIGLAIAIAVRKRETDEADPIPIWIALWFAVTVVLAIGAFGGGWYLRFTPQRLMVIIAVPLSMLSAMGFDDWRGKSSKQATAWLFTTVACGVVSIIVGVFWLQGPLGGHAGEGVFPQARAGLMTKVDDELIARITGGSIAAPINRAPYFGDIIGQRKPDSIVVGAGSVGFSNLDWFELRADIAALYHPATEAQTRRAIVDKYCIDVVYCPDTTPVPDETVAAFDTLPWLERMEKAGRGRIYRVRD